MNKPGFPIQFSHDRVYRYTLWREWTQSRQFPNSGEYAMFIGLNPSTADETNDDPTIRRCIGFARSWGYSALCMTNLFAFRATDPRDMKAASTPVGSDNDSWIDVCARCAGIIVAAWGTHGEHLNREMRVKWSIRNEEYGSKLHHLGLTKYGQPKHPLYLRADTKPVLWK